MRRTELTDGIAQVREALETSGLEMRLTTLFLHEERTSDKGFQEKLLDALKTYAVATERFDPAARSIAEALDLHVLSEPATWILLLSAEERRVVRLLHERIRTATRYLPAVSTLLGPAPLAPEAGPPLDDVHHLTVIVAAGEAQPVPPHRIAMVMESMEKLYEIAGHLYAEEPEPLAIAGCDAGNDLTFDFLGSDTLVEALKKLFVEVGDRLVFFRHLDISERIEQATARLALLDEITAQRESTRLSPEQAELLRRRLRDHVAALLEAGAFIPEIEEHTRFDPRELIGPAPRLLADTSSATQAHAPALGGEAAPEPSPAASKPWHITPALPTRSPDESATSDQQVPAADDADEARAEDETQKTDRIASANRVAYLLDEIKRPASRQRRDD